MSSPSSSAPSPAVAPQVAVRHQGRRGLGIALLGLLLFSGSGVTLLFVLRHTREKSAERSLGEQVDRGPKLQVVKVGISPGARTVTLPGDVRPFLQATLYAKTPGYLRTLSVDKGDAVKKDQRVGVIESPETDQQVAAARADLAVKQRFADRARRLAPSGVVAQQELERAEGDLDAARAGLARVRALQGYQSLRAPFDGVVTQRFVDPGALLQAAVPILEIADATRIKVSVNVGQDAAPFVRIGDPVTLVVDERPDLQVEGTVTRVATALDTRSRTMSCEVWLDNRETKILPGTFVHATLHLKAPSLPTLPTEALFQRGPDLLVAVVENERATLRKVVPGLNDGRSVQVRSGLVGGEVVALNFPSELPDGAAVQPLLRKTPSADTPQHISGGSARTGEITGQNVQGGGPP